MKRTTLRYTLAAMLSLLAIPLVNATSFSYTSSNGSIQYDDPSCTTSYSMTNNVITCVSGEEPPPSPSPVGTCSVSGGGTYTLASGQTSMSRTLTANCQYATQWQWSQNGNAVQGATGQTFSPTLSAGTHSFSVLATNANDATGKTATASVTINAAPQTNCTNTNSYTIDSGFQSAFETHISYFLNVNAGATKAVSFTPNTLRVGQISRTALTGGSVKMYISECPGVVPSGYSSTDGCVLGNWGLNGLTYNNSATCNLGTDPNKTWYFNIKNTSTSTGSSLQIKNF